MDQNNNDDNDDCGSDNHKSEMIVEECVNPTPVVDVVKATAEMMQIDSSSSGCGASSGEEEEEKKAQAVILQQTPSLIPSTREDNELSNAQQSAGSVASKPRKSNLRKTLVVAAAVSPVKQTQEVQVEKQEKQQQQQEQQKQHLSQQKQQVSKRKAQVRKELKGGVTKAAVVRVDRNTVDQVMWKLPMASVMRAVLEVKRSGHLQNRFLPTQIPQVSRLIQLPIPAAATTSKGQQQRQQPQQQEQPRGRLYHKQPSASDQGLPLEASLLRSSREMRNSIYYQ